ncbi:MAG: PEP-CTERM sorting domain-containing protein [Planctomycetia bacterium]|nr:PEP-CTERM sorting domain-containing protein [Planctomycetia bacterium]
MTNFFENAVDLYQDNGTRVPGHFIASDSAGLYQPSGIAIGPDGNIYVSSLAHTGAGNTQVNSQVLVYDRNGQPVGDGIYGDVGSSIRLASLAFGPTGLLYVSSLPDLGSSPVTVFNGLSDSPAGTILGADAFAPSAVTVDANGNLFVANFVDGTIYRVTASNLTNPGAFNSSFLIPYAIDPLVGAIPGGMVMGDDGSLYVTLVYGNAVIKVAPGVNQQTGLHDVSLLYFDTDFIPPSPGSSFGTNALSGIIFDQDGKLIVSKLGPSNPGDGIYPLGGLFNLTTDTAVRLNLAIPIPPASALALFETGVPEPSTAALGLLGFAGMAWVFIRRRRR